MVPQNALWESLDQGLHQRVLGVRKPKSSQENPLVFIRLFGSLFTPQQWPNMNHLA